MVLPGETISTGASPFCCGKKLKIEVLESAAGYYIGTFCPNCGPVSRESILYWRDFETASDALNTDNWQRRK